MSGELPAEEPRGPSSRAGGGGVDVTRWLLYGFAFLLALVLVVSAFLSPHVPAGEPAPELSLERFEGGRVTLAELRGKVVLLDFWATWCGPCIQELPVLVRLAKEYEPRGLAFVAASRDEPLPAAREQVARYLQRRLPALAPHVAFADDEVAARYRVQALPTLYLIGSAGQVLDAHTGLLSEASLRERIEKALAAPRTP